MRKLFTNSLLLFFAALAITFASCGHGSDGHTHGEEAQTDQATDAKSGPEYTAHYICPMHCKGSGSEVAGKCPVCGMDYVANPDHKHGTGHEGHNHETGGHEGHNHGDGEGHEGHNHGDGEGHEGHNH